MHKDRWLPFTPAARWLPVGVGLLTLLLYSLTAAPSIVELYDDSLEFQLVGPTFGIAHPTGYPLYILLGGLWSRLLFPVGNWAWRMNLFSALCGAAAVTVLFLLARRLAGNGGGLVAALLFALGPIWWQQTTVAEVYALHGLFVALILYTTVRLERRSLGVLGLLIGFSLAHHRTTLLLLPPVVASLLWTEPRLARPQREWLRWGLALALPFLLYLYIPLRAANGIEPLEGDYVNTWTGFWDHVLARTYTTFLGDNALAVARTPADWLAVIRAQGGWLGLILGMIGLGIGLLTSRQRPAWVMISLTLAINLAFAMRYRVADAEVFAIPVFLCLALASGLAAERLISHISAQIPWRRRTLYALLLAAILLVPGGRDPIVNRSQAWTTHDYAVALATVDFPPQSRVVGLRGQISVLQYMQQAEGLGQAAIPVALDDPAARQAFVAAGMAAGYPLFLTQEVAGIGNQYSFSAEGPLVRVWPRGSAQPGMPSMPLALCLGDDLLCVRGYDLTVLDEAGGPALRVAFYWQAQRPLPAVLKLSLRMLAENGDVVGVEDRFPLRQVALTPDWLPGEIVRDVHYLPYPAPACHLLVIPYDATTATEIGRFTLTLPTLPAVAAQ